MSRRRRSGLTIRCAGCDRRLVDIAHDPHDHDYTFGSLTATARPGVDLHTYRPAAGVRELTVTVTCPGVGGPCGRTYALRMTRLWTVWVDRHADDHPVTVHAGRDV